MEVRLLNISHNLKINKRLLAIDTFDNIVISVEHIIDSFELKDIYNGLIEDLIDFFELNYDSKNQYNIRKQLISIFITNGGKYYDYFRNIDIYSFKEAEEYKESLVSNNISMKIQDEVKRIDNQLEEVYIRSRVKFITRRQPFYQFYKMINKDNVSFITYKKLINYGDIYEDIDKLVLEDSLRRNDCRILLNFDGNKILVETKKYTTNITFNAKTIEYKTDIIDIYMFPFNILIESEKHLVYEIIPKLSVDNMYVLFDLMTSGKFCKYILINETLDTITSKYNNKNKITMIIGFPINILSNDKTIYFKTLKRPSFSHKYKYEFAITILSQLIKSFHETKYDVIDNYYGLPEKTLVEPSIIPKVRLLTEIKKYVSYPEYAQKCVSHQQPYPVQSKEEFLKKIEKDNLEGILEYDKVKHNAVVDDYLLSYNKALFACIPRYNNRADSNDYRFPKLKEGKYPCCYKKLADAKSTLNRPLNIMKPAAGRIAEIPPYISTIINDRRYRLSVGNTVREILDIRTTFDSKIINDILDSKVIDKNSLNLLSFLSKKNIIMMENINKYDSILLVVKYINHTVGFPYTDFIVLIETQNQTYEKIDVSNGLLKYFDMFAKFMRFETITL